MLHDIIHMDPSGPVLKTLVATMATRQTFRYCQDHQVHYLAMGASAPRQLLPALFLLKWFLAFPGPKTRRIGTQRIARFSFRPGWRLWSPWSAFHLATSLPLAPHTRCNCHGTTALSSRNTAQIIIIEKSKTAICGGKCIHQWNLPFHSFMSSTREVKEHTEHQADFRYCTTMYHPNHLKCSSGWNAHDLPVLAIGFIGFLVCAWSKGSVHAFATGRIGTDHEWFYGAHIEVALQAFSSAIKC